MASHKRIAKELLQIQASPIPGLELTPSEDNIAEMTALITGQGIYANGKFRLTVTFPPEYPFQAPVLKFLTRVYHPNIDEEGNICIALLKQEAWKPSTSLTVIFNSLISLLNEPNPDDPLDVQIAQLYRQDYSAFSKKAGEWVKKYAK